MKVGQRQYGLLAPRDAVLIPWYECHVDDVGPWTIYIKQKPFHFFAMTMIEPVYHLMEIVPRREKHAFESVKLFEQHWLARYPRPIKVINDGGASFKKDFQMMLMTKQIKVKSISPYTPTANSILEHTHKAIAQVVRTMIANEPPKTHEQAFELLKDAFATAMHAHRCASNRNLGGLSPGAVAFQRDMNLNLPLIVDIHLLHKYRQHKIDEALVRANINRIPHDYAVGERVYKKVYHSSSQKAKPIYRGPYEILRVHTNNTVTIKINEKTQERLSIRLLKPALLHQRRRK